MRRRIAIVGLLLAAAGVAWIGTRGRGPAEVEVARVRRTPIVATFTADGVVSGRSVDVAPQIAGRIQALLVHEGQAVRAGQALVRLDDREWRAAASEADAAVRAAQSLLAQAETALTLARQQAAAREAVARANADVARSLLQQVLAGARPQEIAQAQQRVEMAAASLSAAEQTLRRARELFAEGGIARAALDEAEARHRVAAAEHRAAQQALALLEAGARPEERAAAQARVDAAEAELRAARAAGDEVRLREDDVRAARARLHQAAAAADRARAMLAGTVVAAPFDGVVTRLPFEVGHLATPGVPVVTLVDPTDLWVTADIAAEDAAKVHASQEVVVTAAAYPGRRFRGRVAEVAPQAETRLDMAIRTRIVRARVALDDGTDLLRPGLEVDVEGTRTIVPSALAVPTDAVLLRPDRLVVMVVENGVARERDVRTGYQSVEWTEILRGLREGELVVHRGKEGLADGQRVRVVRVVGD